MWAIAESCSDEPDGRRCAGIRLPCSGSRLFSRCEPAAEVLRARPGFGSRRLTWWVRRGGAAAGERRLDGDGGLSTVPDTPMPRAIDGFGLGELAMTGAALLARRPVEPNKRLLEVVGTGHKGITTVVRESASFHATSTGNECNCGREEDRNPRHARVSTTQVRVRPKLVPLAVGGRGTAGHVDHLERVYSRVGVEEDTPVPDAAAEGGLSLQATDVAGEGITAHRLKSGDESVAIELRSAGDRFLRGLSEDELPGRCGAHQG